MIYNDRLIIYRTLKTYSCFIYLKNEVKELQALRKSIRVSCLITLGAIIITIIVQDYSLWLVVSLISGFVIAFLYHYVMMAYEMTKVADYNDEQRYPDDTRSKSSTIDGFRYVDFIESRKLSKSINEKIKITLEPFDELEIGIVSILSSSSNSKKKLGKLMNLFDKTEETISYLFDEAYTSIGSMVSNNELLCSDTEFMKDLTRIIDNNKKIVVHELNEMRLETNI